MSEKSFERAPGTLMRRLVILDRDGVINHDSPDYIKSVAEWHPIPGSIEAIATLSRAGFIIGIASNQAGIGRGLLSQEALEAIHQKLRAAVAAQGGTIDEILFAPEHPDQATPMRKPAPGMLIEIARRGGVSMEGVPFVGDSPSDLMAAQAAGAKPVLVLTGSGPQTLRSADLSGVAVYDDLAAFAAAWLEAS